MKRLLRKIILNVTGEVNLFQTDKTSVCTWVVGRVKQPCCSDLGPESWSCNRWH